MIFWKVRPWGFTKKVLQKKVFQWVLAKSFKVLFSAIFVVHLKKKCFIDAYLHIGQVLFFMFPKNVDHLTDMCVFFNSIFHCRLHSHTQPNGWKSGSWSHGQSCLEHLKGHFGQVSCFYTIFDNSLVNLQIHHPTKILLQSRVFCPIANNKAPLRDITCWDFFLWISVLARPEFLCHSTSRRLGSDIERHRLESKSQRRSQISRKE